MLSDLLVDVFLLPLLIPLLPDQLGGAHPGAVDVGVLLLLLDLTHPALSLTGPMAAILTNRENHSSLSAGSSGGHLGFSL